MTTLFPPGAAPAVWITGPQEGGAPAEPVRPRNTIWPYAGVVAGVAGVAGGMLLAQSQDAFEDDFVATTDSVYATMNSARSILVGGSVAFVGLVAGAAFLVGLIRHIHRQLPDRENMLGALRMGAAAFVGTSSIGVAVRYIASGGADGGIDEDFYSKEASTVLAVFGDQMAFAAMLPGLLVMGIVAFAALRHRVLPRTVGALTLVLTAVSVAMTLVLGLPYSAGLVVPLFLLLTGAAGIFSRKAV